MADIDRAKERSLQVSIEMVTMRDLSDSILTSTDLPAIVRQLQLRGWSYDARGPLARGTENSRLIERLAGEMEQASGSGVRRSTRHELRSAARWLRGKAAEYEEDKL